MPIPTAGTYEYFAAPFEWQETVHPAGPDEVEFTEAEWVAPEGSVGHVEIGPMDHGSKESPSGWVICWKLAGSAAPAGSVYLGDHALDVVSAERRGELESRLGLSPNSISSGTLIDVIWDLLTTHADIDGVARAKPLVPTVAGDLELHMPGHSLVRSEAFKWGEHAHTGKLRDLLQAEYARLKGQVALGRIPDTLPNEVLGWQEQRYARMGLTDYKELLPPQYRNERPSRPGTTIADDFTQSSDTDLESHTPTGTNAGSGWTAIGDATSVQVLASSDRAQNVQDGGAFNLYAMDDTLSGTDMTVDADVGIATAAPNNDLQYAGVWGRLPSASSDTDYYRASIHVSGNTLRLYYRASSGTETQISSVTPTTTAVATLTALQLSCDGSTIAVSYDGTEDISVTNTQVTTGNYAGIRGNTNSSVRDPMWDNFIAADISGTTYDETGRAVTITAVVTVSDQLIKYETGLSVTVTAEVSVSDAHTTQVETGLSTTVLAVVSVSDSHTTQIETGLAVTILAETTVSDLQTFVETGRAVTVLAVVTVSDALVQLETGLSVVVTAVVSVSDSLSTQIETGRAVTVLAVVTVGDSHTTQLETGRSIAAMIGTGDTGQVAFPPNYKTLSSNVSPVYSFGAREIPTLGGAIAWIDGGRYVIISPSGGAGTLLFFASTSDLPTDLEDVPYYVEAPWQPVVTSLGTELQTYVDEVTGSVILAVVTVSDSLVAGAVASKTFEAQARPSSFEARERAESFEVKSI